MLSLIEQVRAAAKPLIQHADNLMGSPYEEDEAIAFVLQLKSDGVQDSTITAQRLNEAGFRALGVRWDLNNYRNWAGDVRVMRRTKTIQDERNSAGRAE